MSDCPKCSCKIIITRYYSEYGREALRRKCNSCKYAWFDNCNDMKQSDLEASISGRDLRDCLNDFLAGAGWDKCNIDKII